MLFDRLAVQFLVHVFSVFEIQLAFEGLGFEAALFCLSELSLFYFYEHLGAFGLFEADVEAESGELVGGLHTLVARLVPLGNQLLLPGERARA